MIHRPDPARSRAVLVGVSVFAEPGRWPALPSVRHNLDDLHAVLTDQTLWGLPASHIEVLADPDDASRVMRAVHRAAKDAQDTVVVYFAGHGTPSGSDLLLPVSGTGTELLTVEGLRYSVVRDLLRERRADHAVMLLDCCFSGIAHALGDVEALLDQQIGAADSAYVLTSSARDMISVAPPGERNTAFTGELLRVLRDGLPSPHESLPMREVTRDVARGLAARRLPGPRHSQSGAGDGLALTRNRLWRPPRPSGDAPAPAAPPDAELAVPGSGIVLRPFPERFDPIDPDRARGTPSLLLRADRAVVEFIGRDRERARFAQWRRGNGVGVRLLHAGGGQGKTRLARQLAEEWAADGWRAWHAVVKPKDGKDEAVPAAGEPHAAGAMAGPAGTLIVVDYADRWPADRLRALLKFAIRERTGPVRVLLLARSAGDWWSTVFQYAAGNGAVPDTMGLSSHTPEVPDRLREFTRARVHFARALGIPAAQLPPVTAESGPVLTQSDFSLVLTVHMAALVNVLATPTGEEAPVDPVAVSAALLRREYVQWEELVRRDEHTGPQVPDMRTAVYAVTLAGGLRSRQARQALNRLDAKDPALVTSLLNLHRECYPPLTDAASTGLEPLYPDRLAEDFLALTTPGHPVTDHPPKMEAEGFAAALLEPRDTEPGGPSWTPAALTRLLETSGRWPHMADRVLYPLLLRHPQLAVAAGGAFLLALAERLDVAEHLDLLLAVRGRFPSHRSVELAEGIAAIEERLTRHDVEQARTELELAVRADERVRQYADAGLAHKALREAEVAVDAWQGLVERDPSAHTADLARALASLASRQWAVGAAREAAGSAEEALRLIGREDGAGSPNPSARADVLSIAASVLQDDAGQDVRARAGQLAEKAVAVLRPLSGGADDTAPAPGSPGPYTVALAHALTVLCGARIKSGDPEGALTAGEEAVGLWRRLNAEGAFLPELSEALNMVAQCAADTGRRGLARRRGQESVRHLRQLDRGNAAYARSLAIALINLAGYHRDLSDAEAAQAYAAESLAMAERHAPDGSAPLAALARDLAREYAVILRDSGRTDAAQALEEHYRLYEEP